MHSTAVSYEQVWIADWAAHSAAGDHGQTWTAVNAKNAALIAENGLLAGRALPASVAADLRMNQLLQTCLDSLTQAPLDAEPYPVIAVTASKGNTGRWLPPAAAENVVLHGPGSQSAFIARTCGVRHFLNPQPIAACSTGLYAVLAAADQLEHGRADVALAGAVDASLQPLMIAGFNALGVLSHGTKPGFAIGEGAGLLRLTNHQPVTGWQLKAGVRLGDASHETRCADPAVLKRCLQGLWDLAPHPSLIITHATGTRVGDAYEFAGLDDGPWQAIPRVSFKPYIGHCLGASGAVELAAALEAPVQSLWKLGLGFGGHVAAVAVHRIQA